MERVREPAIQVIQDQNKSLRERFLAALTGLNRVVKPDPFPEETKRANAILQERNLRRLQKHAAKRGRPARDAGWPGGRKWYPRTTGQPDWFKSMLFKQERQRLLTKIPTSSLVQEFKGAMSFQDSYPNVWALSQAPYADLLALPGVGPAKLKALRAFLSSKNVACAWRVPA